MISRQFLTALLIAFGPLSVSPALAAGETCPTQARPSPLDAVHPVDNPVTGNTVTFAATPSLQFPSEAWVVRVYRTSKRDGESRSTEVIEVFRLQLEYDCNRWFTTGLWDREAKPGDLEEIQTETKRFLGALAQAYVDGGSYDLQFSELALDGTGVAVEEVGRYFSLRRGGHSSGAMGKPLSLGFHRLAATVAPATEMPDEAWRRKR